MIRNYLIARKSHLLPLAIIFLLGLLPLWYSIDGLLIFGGDTGPYMFQLPHIYVWYTTSSGTGLYNPTVVLNIPFQTFYSFLNTIGVPLSLSQAMLNCIWFMGAGLSMYFLAISLFNGRKLRFVATAAAIFYMFNPYNMLNWCSPDPVILSAYASYPLLLALFVRGLRSKRILRSGIFFGLGSLIFVTGNVNISFTVIIIFTLVLYFIFHLIFISKNTKERLGALRFALIAAAMYLLVNLWWIMPLIPFYGEGTQMLAGMDLRGWLEEFSSYSSILNVSRLYGCPGWEIYNWGRPSWSYVPTLMHNSFFIAVSFLPPILFGIALILNRRIKENGISKILLFAFLFYLLSIFLSKGVQTPFGGVYLWLFEHIPGFTVFRSGFVKFGIMIALSSAILFGISLFILYQHIKKVRSNALRRGNIGKVMMIAFVSLILVLNYPFFTGEVVFSGEGSAPSFHHQIPEYHFEAADWINDQTGDFKLLQLYGGGGGWVVYNWGGDAFWENGILKRWGDIYVGGSVDSLFMHRPIIQPQDSFLSNYIRQQLVANSTMYIDKLLNLMNVKYILLHNNFNPAFYGGPPPEVFKNSLSFQKNISLEKTFGELDLYINKQWQDTQIYSASHIIPVHEDMVSVEESIKPGRSVLFFPDQLTTKQLEFITSVENALETPQEITYTKINPTEYKVKVTNAMEPFYLVLSESYHPQWKAYIDEKGDETNWIEAFYQKPIPDNDHFMANGYANAWYIDPNEIDKDGDGNFTITLYFWPQSLFYLGAVISLMALAICMVYLFRCRVRGFYGSVRKGVHRAQRWLEGGQK